MGEMFIYSVHSFHLCLLQLAVREAECMGAPKRYGWQRDTPDTKDVRGEGQSSLPSTFRANRKEATYYYRIDGELGNIGFETDLCANGP